MKFNLPRSLIFFLTIFLSFDVLAQSYLSPDVISPIAISAPVDEKTVEFKNEIQEMIKMQKNLNPQDIDFALTEKHLRAENITHIQLNLNRKSFPALYHLLDRCGDTSHEINNAIKKYWKESRPYLTDKRIYALITPSLGYSYPSGHTVGGYV
jgi:hypothetical protein